MRGSQAELVGEKQRSFVGDAVVKRFIRIKKGPVRCPKSQQERDRHHEPYAALRIKDVPGWTRGCGGVRVLDLRHEDNALP
jgi:hypothetical protein